MGNSATDHVLHGPRSYVDYDRAWGNSGLTPILRPRSLKLTLKSNPLGRQLLLSDTAANILSNFLAVFLALAARNLFTISRRILLCQRARFLPTASSTNGVASNETPDPAPQPTETRLQVANSADATAGQIAEIADSGGGASRVGHAEPASVDSTSQSNGQRSDDVSPPTSRLRESFQIIEDSRTPEGAMLKCFRSFGSGLKSIIPMRGFSDESQRLPRIFTHTYRSDLSRNFFEKSAELTWRLLIGMLMLGLYMIALLLGIMAAYPVVGDSVAVSNHPRCRLISTFDASHFNDTELSKWWKYHIEAARESAQYATTCYNTTDGADGCSFFYDQSIKYSATDNFPCPFKNGSDHLCLGGASSAFNLWTGLVDAKVIGINSPLKYTFSRSLTCSPLRMDHDMIQKSMYKNHFLSYRYFYGNRNQTGEFACNTTLPNCSFEIIVQLGLTGSYSLL